MPAQVLSSGFEKSISVWSNSPNQIQVKMHPTHCVRSMDVILEKNPKLHGNSLRNSNKRDGKESMTSFGQEGVGRTEYTNFTGGFSSLFCWVSVYCFGRKGCRSVKT